MREERHEVLADVSFDVMRGETLGVIGHNGVGKSTLLRVLAGIIAPDEGMVINHGVSVSLLSLQAGFLPNLTGRENAILGGMLLGQSKEAMLARLDDIREYSGIGDAFDQPTGTYSNGMKTRLGFAVAIFADADVILLDEVLGVGDFEFRQKSSKTMREIIASDKTVVLVSHDMNLVQQVCDRVVRVERKKVREIDHMMESSQVGPGHG
ncbi:ABC transporter ATP-binding protein [Candidatus Parcubacteria bacterium]|nr:MAG: ABC transporter ATP-binding protein [Candidatus Parcubacteria bacterium]